MTDPLGQSQVLPYICGLAAEGFSFSLISCEKKERYEQNKNEIADICQNNNIKWHPLQYHKKPPILSTVYDVYQMQKLAVKLYHQSKFDIVHSRGYISAIVGLYLQKKFGVKFIFDMRGLWANEKVDAGAWNIKNPLYKMVFNYFKHKEKEFFLKADQTVSLTAAGKKEIQSWDYMKGKQDNITVIPCCVDTALFDINTTDPAKIVSWKNKLKIDNSDFVVSYLGSIGTWYMLPEMLDFFKVVVDSKPTAKLLFITHDEHEKIKTEAAKRGLSDKIIIQSAKRNEVPELLALSHLSLFFIRPTYSKISSSPTKQGEIMAMGIPVICNSGVGDTDTIVKTYHAGFAVSAFDEDSYKKTLHQFFENNIEKEALRTGAIEYFSLKNGVKRYLHVYQNCINLKTKQEQKKQEVV